MFFKVIDARCGRWATLMPTSVDFKPLGDNPGDPVHNMLPLQVAGLREKLNPLHFPETEERMWVQDLNTARPTPHM